MRLPTCVACGLPVLELRGQYTKLDSFLIQGGVPPVASAGTYHSSCLAASPVGPAWGAALVKSFVGTRGFERLAQADEWTVVRNPRTSDTVALGANGVTLALGFAGHAREVPGGAAFAVTEREYALEWDAPLVDDIQRGLRAQRRVAVLEIADQLGIRDRLAHPELLVDAAFQLDPALEPDWRPGFVWAPVEYRVFVPAALIPWAK
jgi:hypothetical protein